ncbi:MAG: hypothetical protein BAJATHORv1_30146 [Candidatus Thorarchaeota archaeon]|nr:MAG: hypothetical protein BAJATHORv1_30146 [Candidatus Thorarchaeota archaeon]
MSDFYPISPLVGITNTSYGAQAGVMDEMWACRVVRGKKIITEKTMTELALDNFVGIIYGHIRVEGLSRHSVAMCAGRLMQFARRYQTSGVSPDFEIPDLVRDGEDGTEYVAVTPSSSAESGGSSEAVPEESEVVIESAHIGSLPELKPIVGNKIWEKSVESHAIILNEAIAYASDLGQEHLEALLTRIANSMLKQWINPGNPHQVVTKFCQMIQGCSKESQLPKTGTNKLTVETGRCEVLWMARELDPDADKFPAGYPCAFHEMLAAKIAEIAGLEINVNTSSIGCTVDLKLPE